MQPSFPTQSPMPQQMSAEMKENQIMQTYKAAASIFYNIALFSLVNSIINVLSLRVYFPIGLGTTQVIDGFAFVFAENSPEIKAAIFIVAFILDVGLFGIVAIFGYIVSKRTGWLIPVGGALYLLDGLVLLFFQDWIGAAFHAYFLYRIFVSWQAVRNVEKENAAPIAIGV
jgi:hypothetical protein